MLPKIVSADDHVIEPPNIWVDRLPRKYLDRAPRVEYLPVGTRRSEAVDLLGAGRPLPGTDGPPVAFWHYEDKYWALPIVGAGLPLPVTSELKTGTYDDLPRGHFDPQARLEAMDVNGIEASLCFPNYPRFAGQIFLEAADKDLALLCVKAYNDWMVEEWCGASNGRLIPLCLVPLWDARLAAQEVRRNAERGVTVVCFTELPTYLDLPSIHSGYWNPFFEACNETNSVVAMHIGSGSKTFRTSVDMPGTVGALFLYVNSAASMVEYLTSGVMARFPDLKLFFAESQAGWIPYVLERADDLWQTSPSVRGPESKELPTTYYHGRVFTCIFKDHVASRLLDLIGPDQVMFESDYPHPDGTWPKTPDCAEDISAGFDDATKYKICRGNAIDLFRLNLS